MKSLTISLFAWATLLLSAIPVNAQRLEEQILIHTIKVSGESEVKIIPDQAVIIIGVETVNKSMSEAKKQNDKQVGDIAKIAARYGVPAGDIGTDYISANPKYDYRDGEESFVGYDIRRPMTVTLNNIGKFDSLLTDLLDSGITRIQKVQFQTTELRKYKDQARSMAIRAASEKASALAAELGLKIGKAQTIVEKSSDSNDFRSWYGYWGNWYGYNNMGASNPFNSSTVAMPSSPSQNDDAAATLGKISVSAGVDVVFELE